MVIEKLDIHMQQNEIRFFSYPTCNQLKKDERIKHQTWNSNKKHRQKSFTVLVLAQAIREPPVDTCEGSPPPCPLQHFPAERGGGQQPALRVSCAVWPEGHSEAFKKSRYEERCIYWYKWSRKRLVLNNVEGRYCFRNKWQKQTFKYREHTDGHKGGGGLGGGTQVKGMGRWGQASGEGMKTSEAQHREHSRFCGANAVRWRRGVRLVSVLWVQRHIALVPHTLSTWN